MAVWNPLWDDDKHSNFPRDDDDGEHWFNQMVD